MNKKVSKTMSYLLRHDPEGMEIDSEGFVKISELRSRLQKRDLDADRALITSIVETDPKGRYEIQGSKIRARYGHSIEVHPTLPEATCSILYHGTTQKALSSIQKEGLKAQGRQLVHLSTSVEEAKNVGKRHSSSPVILEVDVDCVRGQGISIHRASDRVYVAERVPPDCIEVPEQ